MPHDAHSIVLSAPEMPTEAVVETIWRALRDLRVKSGGSYTLERYDEDRSNAMLVASHSGSPVDRLPQVHEAPDEYDVLTYSLWIDTMEILMLVDARSTPIRYSLVFMGNAIRSPGPHWLARACEALVSALGIEVATLLASGGQETETASRLAAGMSLSALVIEAARGTSPLGPPLLAVLDPATVPPDLYDAARDAGVRVAVLPTGAVMLSTIHG